MRNVASETLQKPVAVNLFQNHRNLSENFVSCVCRELLYRCWHLANWNALLSSGAGK